MEKNRVYIGDGKSLGEREREMGTGRAGGIDKTRKMGNIERY